MKRARVEGVALEYFELPGSPTLVFLHEGLGSALQWRDFPQQLAQATGCGALVYSRAGYGGSGTDNPGPTQATRGACDGRGATVGAGDRTGLRPKRVDCSGACAPRRRRGGGVTGRVARHRRDG